MLYPIARRQNEALAIGYVAARIIECVFLAAGIIFVLGVVSLRQDVPGADEVAFTLAALKDWTFLFGPGLVVPFGNGLILGYLMYRSGLVPRRMAWLGLIRGPLLLIGNFDVLRVPVTEMARCAHRPTGNAVPVSPGRVATSQVVCDVFVARPPTCHYEGKSNAESRNYPCR